MTLLNRRQFLAAAGGVTGAVASGVLLGGHVWPLLTKEDLIPGTAPDIELPANAWTTTPQRLRFAALGDNGSGGRQAMAVARRMAQTYLAQPFGLVSLLGDICYYGNFEKRYEDVFRRPMQPLIDAGVGFELAIGNHDPRFGHSDEGEEEIEAELRLLGTPSPYYVTTHGPADLFYLDSSGPAVFGPGASAQWEWLDDSLASATSQWRIVSLHHPLYSSGRHGSTVGARERLEPILTRHRVDLVLAGHDHNYERTHPQKGITYVVSGGGCKTTSVGRSSFTASAASILQFLLVDIDDDRLTGRCISVDGDVADRFELRAREGR
ncbi:MAG: metallophosphoesterase [Acidimicrobiales bacterium]